MAYLRSIFGDLEARLCNCLGCNSIGSCNYYSYRVRCDAFITEGADLLVDIRLPKTKKERA